jgi:hypothetical protein
MVRTARLSGPLSSAPAGVSARRVAEEVLLQINNQSNDSFWTRFHAACGGAVRGGGEWLSQPNGNQFERVSFLDLTDSLDSASAVAAASRLWGKESEGRGEGHAIDVAGGGGGDATRCMETQRVAVHGDDRVKLETTTVPDAAATGQAISNLFRLETQIEITSSGSQPPNVAATLSASCTTTRAWGLGGMVERAVLRRAVAAHEVWMAAVALELRRQSTQQTQAAPATSASPVRAELPSDWVDDESTVRLAHLRRVLAGTEKLQGVLRAAAQRVYLSQDEGSDDGKNSDAESDYGVAHPVVGTRARKRPGNGNIRHRLLVMLGICAVLLLGWWWWHSTRAQVLEAPTGERSL